MVEVQTLEKQQELIYTLIDVRDDLENRPYGDGSRDVLSKVETSIKIWENIRDLCYSNELKWIDDLIQQGYEISYGELYNKY